MKIYVSIVCYGENDDYRQEVIYVGDDPEIALVRIQSFQYPEQPVWPGVIQTWKNGEMVNGKLITL